MKKFKLLFLSGLLSFSMAGQAEMLAMVNYDSQAGVSPRREGIAIIDIDRKSAHFGEILSDLPLPPDAHSHHFFYNKDLSKAYITSLGNGPLRVMKMNEKPYRIELLDVPQCQVAEDMVFTSDKKTWYLTCMGSSNVIMGDAMTDKVKKVIQANGKETFIRYPHGISLNEAINRLIVTSTANPADLKEAGETVTVIDADSGNVLSTHKVTAKAGSAPVEAVFVPHIKPPLVYISTMNEGKLWLGKWQGKRFDFEPIYDFSHVNQGVPLEIYFNKAHDRLYVTSAKPGALNIFDISGDKVKQPVLIKSIPTDAGSHHVVFTPDEKYAFVQNNLLNLPEMDDGSITVIDLQKMTKIDSIDTFKKQGLKPHDIYMLPPWHTDDAH